MYVYLSCYYMATYISYTERQAALGICVIGIMWIIGITISGGLYNGNVIDLLTFFVGNGIMLVLTYKLKSDEFLAFKY
jgi:hypothetical protein